MAELCPPTRMSNDHLRRAMELDRYQFNNIVVSDRQLPIFFDAIHSICPSSYFLADWNCVLKSILRYLANCTLDNVYWEDQDAEKREMFIAKVRCLLG